MLTIRECRVSLSPSMLLAGIGDFSTKHPQGEARDSNSSGATRAELLWREGNGEESERGLTALPILCFGREERHVCVAGKST